MSVNGKGLVYNSNNPLFVQSYNGHTFTYEGRRLVKYTDSKGTYTFTYNDQGLRTSKKHSNGKETKYYYDGDRLITEITPDYRNDYLYDENGLLYGFIYNSDEKYLYIRDSVQNIIGIVDDHENFIVEYGYTAYGDFEIINHLPDSIGVINPFRYKGYYYDNDLNMYYCKSRYYVPEWCRWLTPDSIDYLEPTSINGLNLYAYCGNNPVMYYDPDGHAFISALLISIAIAAVIGGATAGFSAYQSGERGWDLVADIAGGAIFGAAIGATIALGGAAGLAATGASVAGFGLTTGAAFGISVGATTLAGMAKYSLNCVASDENHWNFGGFVLSGVEGALQGAATFCLAFVGGKTGLFNKLGNFSSQDVFFTKFGGMNTMRAIVCGSKVLIGETLSKALFVSGSAALARWLIDLMIPNLY